MQVVPQSDRWTGTRLALQALYLGITCGIVLSVSTLTLITAKMQLPGMAIYTLVFILTVFCLVGVPLYVAIRIRHQIENTSRAWVAGLCFGAGVPVIAVALNVLLIFFDPQQMSAMLVLIVCCGISAVLYGTVHRIIWSVARNQPPRVVYQDGTQCPGCGYTLVGNTSMICPECGRAFSLHELGTTAEALTRGREAEPA